MNIYFKISTLDNECGKSQVEIPQKNWKTLRIFLLNKFKLIKIKFKECLATLEALCLKKKTLI